jgi:hypothetical protein
MVLVAFTLMINVPRNLKNILVRNLMSLRIIFIKKFKNSWNAIKDWKRNLKLISFFKIKYNYRSWSLKY